MTAKTPATRKAKGRKLQQDVVKSILLKFSGLTDRDVVSVPMGVSSEDIRLSEAAFKQFPFAVECKNTERLDLWKSIKQTEAQKRIGTPLLVFKRNRSDTYCCLKFSDLLDLLKGTDNERKTV